MAKGKKKREAVTFGDVKKYERHGVYEFPFDVLDPTPGGKNLGRIEWAVEIHPATKRRGENRKRIREVWVWASQTIDPRYRGLVFRFETIAESLGFDSLRRSFAPWRVGFCCEHRGAVILEAYPENHHTKFIIAPSSSISCEVKFA